MMEGSSTGVHLELYGPSRILLLFFTRTTTSRFKGLGLVSPWMKTSTFSSSLCYDKKHALLGSLSLGNDVS